MKYDEQSVMKAVREEQQEDILTRYNNEEYWDNEIEDRYLQDIELKINDVVSLKFLHQHVEARRLEIKNDTSKDNGLLVYNDDQIIMELEFFKGDYKVVYVL